MNFEVSRVVPGPRRRAVGTQDLSPGANEETFFVSNFGIKTWNVCRWGAIIYAGFLFTG